MGEQHEQEALAVARMYRETRETHCKRCTAPLPESVPQSEFCTSECERDYKQFGGWRV